MGKIKKITVYAVCYALFLSGCVTNSGSLQNNLFGPRLSSYFSLGKQQPEDPNKPKLDVIIPVFDPGLSEDASNYEESGVWPELRRAEANRFAFKLKAALEETGKFGAVRVTPDRTATGDLYVFGTIDESDGEDVEIDIEVFDISGTRWFSDSFDHSVDEGFHKNLRNKGKDPYDPVFEEAAAYLAEEVKFRKTKDMENLRLLTDLRFGASFSEEAFAKHLVFEDGRITLGSYPSANDPMLVRTKAIRVRDQLYVDGLQDHYRTFSEQMGDSYLLWQEQSLAELKAKREAELEAAGEAVVGALALALAVVAVAASADSDDPGDGAAALTAGIAAGAVGGALIQESFQTSKEAKVHRDALEELGESIDLDLAPKVIEFEMKTVRLTGTAKEQFAQWRQFLKTIYLQEKTPDVQL
jgi:hypothetical protein